MILVIIESFLLNFVLLMVCVMNIRNSPVGGVHWYEKNVQDRVVELGLITKEQIKKNMLLSFIPFMIVLLILAPMMVFFINGAENFLEGFVQLTVMFEICGIFDRVFIDWYWVNHTKAWIIEGTYKVLGHSRHRRSDALCSSESLGEENTGYDHRISADGSVAVMDHVSDLK